MKTICCIIIVEQSPFHGEGEDQTSTLTSVNLAITFCKIMLENQGTCMYGAPFWLHKQDQLNIAEREHS